VQKSDWSGVFSAITTPFDSHGRVDEKFLYEHVCWLLDHGCRGIVALGSLGEGATLTFNEKVRILEVCRDAMELRAPLIAGISGLSTAECVALAQAAHEIGCDGLMVLPAYVYLSDPRETQLHFDSVIAATPLSCILYNNPIAYGTDLSVDDIEGYVTRHRNVHAVKDSTGDVRRMTAVRERLGDHVRLFAGLDDMVVEAGLMGADGWVAGLVNALPEESVRLFELARAGNAQEAIRLYEWFLPLLRFDTVPKFVQLIKLVQAQVGKGSETVRAPRLPLAGSERDAALAIINEALATRREPLARMA
jgi:dihydrodipicolinate synthase/N-acetylneuraminate lyase